MSELPTPPAYYNQENLENAPPNHIAYIYDLGDDVHGTTPFQNLVTLDAPGNAVLEGTLCNLGLVIKTLYIVDFSPVSRLYYLPLPGATATAPYSLAGKMKYRWKSKTFSFPGRTTLAAAKVTRGCGGELVFRLYEDCREVYACYVCDCRPFRLPSDIAGVDFQIALEGTAEVSEIHVASSMRELTEEE